MSLTWLLLLCLGSVERPLRSSSLGLVATTALSSRVVGRLIVFDSPGNA